jgi:hypothetical protein
MAGYDKAKLVQMSRWDPWADGTFRSMNSNQKLAWMFISTGPHTYPAVPGLYRLTFAQLYERLDLRHESGEALTRKEVAEITREFFKQGYMRGDGVAGLARLPGVTADMSMTSALVVCSQLVKLPACDLKDEHIVEMMEAVSSQEVIDLLSHQLGR